MKIIFITKKNDKKINFIIINILNKKILFIYFSDYIYLMDCRIYNRNPDIGNEYSNEINKTVNQLINNSEISSTKTVSSENDNSRNKDKKNRKGKFNFSKFDIIKMSLCGIIFILLFIQIILFSIYNKSNKGNKEAIDDLKKKMSNITVYGSMIYKKNLNLSHNKTS